ncbi:MAG: 50S ribosomal protein L22 [Acidimicrobiia bacterium]
MARRLSEPATQSKATARFVWISPYKVRQVASQIKGKPIDEARRILAFTPKAASRDLAKVLESAVANAEHNFSIPQEELFVKSAWADEGLTVKRIQPRARGMAYLIRKRTSHIHVLLERLAPEEVAAAPAPRRRRRAPTTTAEEAPATTGRPRGGRAPRGSASGRGAESKEETQKPKTRRPRKPKAEEKKEEGES